MAFGSLNKFCLLWVICIPTTFNPFGKEKSTYINRKIIFLFTRTNVLPYKYSIPICNVPSGDDKAAITFRRGKNREMLLMGVKLSDKTVRRPRPCQLLNDPA